VNVLDDGTVQVVPEHEAVIRWPDTGRYGESEIGRPCVLCHGRDP
jgi:hypothetical protein